MILAEITVIAFSASGFAGQIGDRAVLLIYLKAIFSRILSFSRCLFISIDYCPLANSNLLCRHPTLSNFGSGLLQGKMYIKFSSKSLYCEFFYKSTKKQIISVFLHRIIFL